MDILKELDSLKADYAAAQTLLDEAKASSETLATQLAEKESTLAAKVASIENLVATVASKDKFISDLRAELSALQAKEKSAEAKAVEIVANVGIKPIEAGVSAGISLTKAEVKAAYLAIKDPVERATYYFAHKAELYDGGK